MLKISSESFETCIEDISKILEIAGMTRDYSNSYCIRYKYPVNPNSPNKFLKSFQIKEAIASDDVDHCKGNWEIVNWEIATKISFDFAIEKSYVTLSDVFFVQKNPHGLAEMIKMIKDIFSRSQLEKLYYDNPKVRGELVATKTCVI